MIQHQQVGRKMADRVLSMATQLHDAGVLAPTWVRSNDSVEGRKMKLGDISSYFTRREGGGEPAIRACSLSI